MGQKGSSEGHGKGRRSVTLNSKNKGNKSNEKNGSSKEISTLGESSISLKFNLNSKRLEDQPYFHGRLPRDDLIELLQKHGDFLVRETQNPMAANPIIISVHWNGRHRHFPIEQDFADHLWKLNKGKGFKDVSSLILYAYKTRLGLGEDKVMLYHAIPRDKYQLAHDEIRLIEQLGSGNFGEVWRGYLKLPGGEMKDVAIKRCKEDMPEDEKKRFMAEARLMKRYQHRNVVQLIGICIQQDPIMIVMEIMPNGALNTYLMRHRETITQAKMVLFCLDSAKGMEYLSNHKCIHRDLAARNVLLDANIVAKISDFGLSREGSQYKVDTVKKLPLKWLAPEAFGTSIFTTKSDVWSFGILMWEVFNHGMEPYPDLNNIDAMHKIKDGYRLSPPSLMPADAAALMTRCWNINANKRPTFTEVREKLCELNGKMPRI